MSETVSVLTHKSLKSVSDICGLLDSNLKVVGFGRDQAYTYENTSVIDPSNMLVKKQGRVTPNGMRVSSVQNAIIFGYGATIVPSLSGVLADSLFWFADRFADDLDTVGSHLDGSRLVRVPGGLKPLLPSGREVEVSTPCFLLMNAADIAYTHMLIDILPKLALWYRFPEPRPKLVISANAAFRWRDMLSAFGVDPADTIVLSPDEMIRAHQLYVASFPQWAYQETIDTLQSVARIHDLVAPRKIYVSRRDAFAWDRRLLNEEEIEDYLSDCGFETIVPSRKRFAEQIYAFRSATMVAGVLGGGTLNAVFCRPGTKVLNLVSPDYKRDYLDVAAPFTGVKNVNVVGSSFSAIRDRNNSAFVVDTQLVKAGLAALSEL